MTYYRLYIFDGSGHIARFHEFEAASDVAALASARERRSTTAMELWSGNRKVRRWDPLAFSPELKARAMLRAARL